MQRRYKLDQYFGEVSICYTNSLAMTLDSYGFEYRPEFLEAIMVMGNGANVAYEDEKHPLVFFDNGSPDRSISNCLRILGFEYDDYYLEDSGRINSDVIKVQLERLLAFGSAIVGPLDMGYLTYNPNCQVLHGVDHFVSVYDLTDNDIYLHDPAGFACLKVNFAEFLKAWKAESIAYKRGSYSMWGNLRKLRFPTDEEIYHETSLVIKKRYEFGEEGVISNYAKVVAENGLNDEQKKLHQYFSFKLASVRNLYLCKFLEKYDLRRSKIKEKLAILFGQAHINSVGEDYKELAKTLEEIARWDNEFRELSINYERI